MLAVVVVVVAVQGLARCCSLLAFYACGSTSSVRRECDGLCTCHCVLSTAREALRRDLGRLLMAVSMSMLNSL